AARLRDRIAALEAVVRELRELERMRRAHLCVLVPALETGYRRAFVVAGGRVAAVRRPPSGGGSRIEHGAGLAAVRGGQPVLATGHVECSVYHLPALVIAVCARRRGTSVPSLSAPAMAQEV